MFEHLKNKRVLVTGPQRSGTTICARMIAHDAGIEYIDEDYISVDSIQSTTDLFAKRKGFVLQAPGLSHVCHEIDADAVVFMLRPVNDIVKSQDEIKWGCESIELAKYGVESGTIASVKYDKWEQQKRIIANPIEVNFNDLSIHPLWVDDRAGFSARQWRHS